MSAFGGKGVEAALEAGHCPGEGIEWKVPLVVRVHASLSDSTLKGIKTFHQKWLPGGAGRLAPRK